MNDRQLHKQGLLTLAVVAGVLMGFLFGGGIPVTAQNRHFLAR
jgi:hypothetical protein